MVPDGFEVTLGVIFFRRSLHPLILLMAAPRHSHFIINDKVAVRTLSKSAMTENWSHERPTTPATPTGATFRAMLRGMCS